MRSGGASGRTGIERVVGFIDAHRGAVRGRAASEELDLVIEGLLEIVRAFTAHNPAFTRVFAKCRAGRFAPRWAYSAGSRLFRSDTTVSLHAN